MGKSTNGPAVDRRRFLTGAAVAGAPVTVTPPAVESAARAQGALAPAKVLPPSAAEMRAEWERRWRSPRTTEAAGQAARQGDLHQGRLLRVPWLRCARRLHGPEAGARSDAADALAGYIRNSAPTLMPPYSEKVLGDPEVADIHAYLTTIKKPPNLKDIPLLSNP
jgi:hypothetical protein